MQKTGSEEPVGNTDDGGQRTISVRWALTGLALSMLLSSLGNSIANIGLPVFAQVFGASFQAVQWVVVAYLLSSTVLIVGVGRLGDLIGRKRLLLAGLVLFTVACVLCGLSSRLWMLIAARALQGLGAAVMTALTLAFVSESVPKARTGSAMGLLGTTTALGTALGPALGGVLIAGLGWPALFLINVPLGVLAAVLAYRYLPRDRPGAARSGLDIAGMLLLTLTLTAYTLAMTLGRGHFEALNLGLLLVAAAGVALFVRAQARAASPLIRLSMLRSPVLSTGLLMNALVMTVMMAVLVVGPFFLSRALGLDAARVGLLMSIGPGMSALSGVVVGRIVDRVGAPFMVIVGLTQVAFGALALALLSTTFGVAGYVAAIVILTPGYQLFLAANNTAVMVDAAANERGVMSGMLNLSRNLGLITGASVMGAVFAFASGASDITGASAEAVTSGMRITFAVGAVLIGTALAIAMGGRAVAARAVLPKDAS